MSNNNNNGKQWPLRKSGNNVRPGPTGRVATTTSLSNDRNSIIRGLDTSTVSTAAELLAAVRQLVKSWSDPTLTDDMVEWVGRSTRFGPTAKGKSNVLITARTVEDNRQLLAGADKYVNTGDDDGGGGDSTGSMRWESYRRYHRPLQQQQQQSAGDSRGQHRLSSSLPSNKIDYDRLLASLQASGNGNIVGHKQSAAQHRHHHQQQQRRPPIYQPTRNDIKSVIRGLDTTGVDNLTAFVRQLVANWKDPKVNSAMIMSVTSNADKAASTDRVTLFVTACGTEASRALIETGQQNGVNWLEYLDPKQLVQQRRQQQQEAREVREVVTNSKCISVIHGLDTSGQESQAMLATVRQLVADCNDPTITAEMIQSVERNTITDIDKSPPDLFVMASDINANSLLLKTVAEKYNSSTGSIIWLPHTFRYHYDPINSQSYTLAITGLDITGVTDLTAFVRQTVDNWKHSTCTGALIVSVEPYVKQVPVSGQQVKLMARAVSTWASRQLQNAARRKRLKWFIVEHMNRNTTTTDLSIGKNSNIIGNTNNGTDNDDVRGFIDKLIDNELSNLSLSDKTKHQSTISNANLNCQLCLADIPDNSSQQFDSKCGHRFCRECLALYLDSKITDGRVHHIKCPDVQCNQDASYELVCLLLSRKSLVKYHKLLLKKTVETMDDMAYCPKCNDSVDIDKARKFGYCNQCDHSFCSACRRPYHGLQRACIDSAADAAAAALLRQRAAEIKESESYINSHFKQCPKCGIPCEKIDGCNHMQCKMCMVHFCWLCFDDITDEAYRKRHYLSKCKLFEYDFDD